MYLGGLINEQGTSDSDVLNRIGLASNAMRRLESIWKAKDIGPRTKVRVYSSIVLGVLLYNAETWTRTADIQRRLRTFKMSCLRRILGVTCLACMRNTDVMDRLNVKQDIVQRLQTRRLRFFGHVVRMPP